MKNISTSHIISDNDLASYVVCPESWRLKLKNRSKKVENTKSRSKESAEKRKEWLETQNEVLHLREYAKAIISLLLILVVAITIWEFSAEKRSLTLSEISGSRNWFSTLNAFILILILCASLVVWEVIERALRTANKNSSIGKKSKPIAIKGSDKWNSNKLFSKELKLQSQPDAIIEKNSYFIPMARQPMTNKIRDRHVVKIIAHLRLLEEKQGKRAPYGLLIMGNEARSVQIEYSDEKRTWLENLLEEMQGILAGKQATPAPAKFKCKNCDVRRLCEHSLDQTRARD